MLDGEDGGYGEEEESYTQGGVMIARRGYDRLNKDRVDGQRVGGDQGGLKDEGDVIGEHELFVM